MRVCHFDCFSGISGDMTLAALFDAGVPTEPVLAGIASLGLPIKIEVEKVRKGGFAATQITVQAPEETEHRFLPDVEEILSRGQIAQKQRELALSIFRRLAQAEAAVHGMPVEKVHFHEVGALDSIADIVGAAIALDLLGAERFTSGAVATGSGMVKCAHGMMPVPAPATAELLKGVPLRAGTIKGELTTPTGAAILTAIVHEWIAAPAMTIEKIGLGAGQRDLLEQPNVLRVFVGQSSPVSPPGRGAGGEGVSSAHALSQSVLDTDHVIILETNLDDVSAEVIGYCYDLLLQSGALDVFTTPIFMKKNRPGTLLSVIAPEAALPVLENILFRETGTLGIRRYPAQRHKLHRKACTVETSWGPVQGKLGWQDGQAPVFSPEYEDCARIARETGLALREVFERVQREHARQAR